MLLMKRRDLSPADRERCAVLYQYKVDSIGVAAAPPKPERSERRLIPCWIMICSIWFSQSVPLPLLVRHLQRRDILRRCHNMLTFDGDCLVSRPYDFFFPSAGDQFASQKRLSMTWNNNCVDMSQRIANRLMRGVLCRRSRWAWDVVHNVPMMMDRGLLQVQATRCAYLGKPFDNTYKADHILGLGK